MTGVASARFWRPPFPSRVSGGHGETAHQGFHHLSPGCGAGILPYRISVGVRDLDCAQLVHGDFLVTVLAVGADDDGIRDAVFFGLSLDSEAVDVCDLDVFHGGGGGGGVVG